MKVIITEKQFNELNNNQKSEWYEFCRKNKYVLHDRGGNDFMLLGFPSIGEMIAFLHQDTNIKANELERRFLSAKHMAINRIAVGGNEKNGIFFAWSGDLCNNLWKVVKKRLKE